VSGSLRRSDFDPISITVFNRQLKVATIFVLVAFAALILRIWFLQLANGRTYRAKSENNRIHLQDIPTFRGQIFDRHGDMLVDNRPAYDLCVIPEEVQDRQALLSTLNRLVGVDPDSAEFKLKNAAGGQPFRPVCLEKDISRDDLAVIETHRFNLPGVIIEDEPQRLYIYGSFASHILGYLGEISEGQIRSGRYPNNKPGDLIGKAGVESKWQQFLNGERGGEQVEVYAAGRKIEVISRKPPVSGTNLYLTIDKDLQSLAEKLLSDKKGAIVAMDPNNGQVLALASSPSFDPNLFISGIDGETWNAMATSKDFPLQNRALSGQYPPGSVFKIIVALAALEEGVVDPEEEIFCGGAYALGSQRYRCWKRYGHGRVNLHRALVESCDVYFYTIGRRLGVDKIAYYAKELGFGKATGFDLGHEKEGLIPTREWKIKRFGIPWQAGETISTSIGQSFVLVTPIQMVAMISAVFNGGVLYTPQVTKRIGGDEKERILEFESKTARRIKVKPEHLDLVKRALIGVVNEPHGTGSKARLKAITVAGKTGTAQVITLEKEKSMEKAEGEVPSKFKDHAWFVALAPAESPRIALAVLVENGGHGGSASAPIAGELIQAYLGGQQVAQSNEPRRVR
jgi:penicillin-binding protein 2